MSVVPRLQLSPQHTGASDIVYPAGSNHVLSGPNVGLSAFSL